MARIKIDLPETFFFKTSIPVRITDLNYGGHVGNDALLSIIHEARVQFLQKFNYSELSVEGLSVIMSDVGIEYKSEVFYGDVLEVKVSVADLTRSGFDLIYKIEKEQNERKILVAAAKTGMLFFDYPMKKVVSMPEAFRNKFQLP